MIKKHYIDFIAWLHLVLHGTLDAVGNFLSKALLTGKDVKRDPTWNKGLIYLHRFIVTVLLLPFIPLIMLLIVASGITHYHFDQLRK